MDRPVYLGTAQWGSRYGATNSAGVPDASEIRRMLASPFAGLDTADSYGIAEERIGRLVYGALAIQTKMSCSGLTPHAMAGAFRRSLDRLRRSVVHTLLIHDWPILSAGERRDAARFLYAAKVYGRAKRVGVSIYEPRDLRSLPDVIEVVQLPASVMNQSVVDSTEAAGLRDRGIAIQARSIYLQGVALRHHDLRTCVGYVKQHPGIDEVVVGCDTAEQADQFFQAWNADVPDVNWRSLAITDRSVIDPRTWA